jgi:acyl dehydratase
MKLIELSPVGQKVVTGTILFTAEDIIRFAEQFDPQPFHIDAEAAKNFIFGGLCASGWHTASNWMRAFLDHWAEEVARLARENRLAPKLGPAAGFQKLQWLRPVYAGDSITYAVTLIASRPLASRPGTLMNTILCEGDNQNGEPVIRFESNVLEFT